MRRLICAFVCAARLSHECIMQRQVTFKQYGACIMQICSQMTLLILKAPSIICSRRLFQLLLFFQEEAYTAWYFMWNVCQLKIHMKENAFFWKLTKMSLNLPSAAFVIFALRLTVKDNFCRLLLTFANCWDLMRGSRKFCQRGSNFDNFF